VCARGARRALLCGPSTSPLGVMQRQTPLPLIAVVALLTSALVPAVLLGVFSEGSGELTHKDLRLVLGRAAFFYPFVVMFAVLFGLPTFLVFRRLQILTWWTAVLAGCAIGVVTIKVVTWGMVGGAYLLLYAAIGGAFALVFWSIWSRAACGRRYNVPNDA
jgi:hypothetical protein